MNKYEEALQNIKETSFIDGSPYNVDMEETYLFDEEDEDIILLEELVERATPKKPIDKMAYNPREKSTPYKACPNCDMIVLKDRGCSNNDCRQALDWSDEE